MKTLAILGRQPALGLAELESLFGPEKITPLPGGACLLDMPASDIPFGRLGSVVKLGSILATLDTLEWKKLDAFLVPACKKNSVNVPEGKLTIGISVYGIDVKPDELERTALNIKKVVKQTGRSVRIVPNKTREISTPQIIHNKLTSENGWELVLYRDGNKTILMRTDFVQDIEAYTARDQARPMRDAKVGMLPPKLAQTIINLATGPNQIKDITVLDPFCGTGVLVQETMLMGYKAYGSDLEPRMVDYSTKNIDWLCDQYSWLARGNARLSAGDSTSMLWEKPYDVVACEGYLGIPFAHMPSPDHLQEAIDGANTVMKGFLKNLAKQVAPGFRACVAMPAWHLPHSVKSLPCLIKIESMGWKRLRFRHAHPKDLVYRRDDQVVGRELVVLVKM